MLNNSSNDFLASSSSAESIISFRVLAFCFVSVFGTFISMPGGSAPESVGGGTSPNANLFNLYWLYAPKPNPAPAPPIIPPAICSATPSSQGLPRAIFCDICS